MRRLDLGLFGALIACAILVVHTQHRARRVFVDLQRERSVGEQLASDLRRLQADQATLAAANRVERAAASLHMHLPAPRDSYALAAQPAQLAALPVPGLVSSQTLALATKPPAVRTASAKRGHGLAR